MTAPLTFHQPHPCGRILLMLGEHRAGAVFPPPTDTSRPHHLWRWSFWLCGYMACKEGKAKSEQAAKNALLAEARDWLRKAGME